MITECPTFGWNHYKTSKINLAQIITVDLAQIITFDTLKLCPHNNFTVHIHVPLRVFSWALCTCVMSGWLFTTPAILFMPVLSNQRRAHVTWNLRAGHWLVPLARMCKQKWDSLKPSSVSCAAMLAIESAAHHVAWLFPCFQQMCFHDEPCASSQPNLAMLQDAHVQNPTTVAEMSPQPNERLGRRRGQQSPLLSFLFLWSRNNPHVCQRWHTEVAEGLEWSDTEVRRALLHSTTRASTVWLWVPLWPNTSSHKSQWRHIRMSLIQTWPRLKHWNWSNCLMHRKLSVFPDGHFERLRAAQTVQGCDKPARTSTLNSWASVDWCSCCLQQVVSTESAMERCLWGSSFLKRPAKQMLMLQVWLRPFPKPYVSLPTQTLPNEFQKFIPGYPGWGQFAVDPPPNQLRVIRAIQFLSPNFKYAAIPKPGCLLALHKGTLFCTLDLCSLACRRLRFSEFFCAFGIRPRLERLCLGVACVSQLSFFAYSWSRNFSACGGSFCSQFKHLCSEWKKVCLSTATDNKQQGIITRGVFEVHEKAPRMRPPNPKTLACPSFCCSKPLKMLDILDFLSVLTIWSVGVSRAHARTCWIF